MQKSFIPPTKMIPEPTMKKELIILFFVLNCLILQAQTLPGFKATGTFGEQQMLIDVKRCLFTDILKDPLRYKIFSDETKPMETVGYRRKL